MLAVPFFVSFSILSGTAAASGFALILQSGSGLGNAYAGGAAAAEDASTLFFNPAGMSRLHGKQLVFAGHLIGVTSQFANTGSVNATGQALGVVPDGGRKLSWIPNGYFATEISPKLHFGIGVNTPFGSASEYRPDWMGRFQAIKSKIETVNLNPSIAYQVNDGVAVGAGLNYQRINAELGSAVNWSALAGGALGVNVEGITTVSGNDSAWGCNLGALFNVSPQTRAGLAYRSAIKYNLRGSIAFANRPTVGSAPVRAALAAAAPDGAVNLAITVPDTFSASIFHRLDDKWDIMADITRTGWSVFDQLKVVRASGATLSLTPENWKNTWRVAVGANHHYNERWTARVGLAYDQSPVPDAFRTARLPDGDRTWLSLGGQYKLGKGSVLDLGYAHLFIKGSSIDRNKGGVNVASTALYAQLAGSYDLKADIMSVQYSYGF